jgi:hypothetical protein
LDIAVTSTPAYKLTNLSESKADTIPNNNTVLPEKESLFFDLGMWLSGLESFLNIRNHPLVEEDRAKAASRDWTKEFRLTHSTLILCSRLTFQLSKALKETISAQKVEIGLIDDVESIEETLEISPSEIYELSLVLKDVILLNEGLMRAAPLKFGEWKAWCNLLSEKLKSVETVSKLVFRAEKTGEKFLPEVLQNLLESKTLPFAVKADLSLVLPRFAKILKWLNAIERMLNSDMPLKTSLLIFSRIHEQIQELISYINNRLLRFPKEDELFGQLDGAAYTASIELRKVYNYELAGILEMRSAPLIYAKVEDAFVLLNDSFQMTLINFARMIEPQIQPHEIFPNLKIKLRQSLDLRQNLWSLVKSVKEAEHNPEKYPLESLHEQLKGFQKTALHYLFYKDRETVERFIEEVLVTRNKKDLVPILHRFGAYLETLFGQVNMRSVLADYPFEYQ